MKFLRKTIFLVAGLTLTMSFTGCITSEKEEGSSMTFSTLQWKMKQAKSYSEFDCYVMTQKTSENTLIKSYYLRPDYAKSETYKDSKLKSVLIFNKDRIWNINVKTQRPEEILGINREKIHIFENLNKPESYDKIFSKINISEKKIKDKWYYELTCQPKVAEISTVWIYVNRETFRLEIIKTFNNNIEFKQFITSYKDFEGIKIPDKIKIVQGLESYEIELVDFNKDIKLTPSDFTPKKPWYE